MRRALHRLRNVAGTAILLVVLITVAKVGTGSNDWHGSIAKVCVAVTFCWMIWAMVLAHVWLTLRVKWWIARTSRDIARTDRLRREGRCLICGYDLNGNVSGVCPEMFSLL